MTDPTPQTVVLPEHERASELVERGIDEGLLVTVFGCCRVDYEGRAASTLPAGDRLVVLKPDGTALVHTDEGHQPVNWQPPGSTHEVVDSDHLELHTRRDSPPELLTVSFDIVEHVALFDVTGEHELSLSGTEADMRERILDDPALVESGFEPRATERETAAGAIDIYGVDSQGNAVVVELKRRRVGPDAVGQLDRYVEALERDLHAEIPVRGVLVAPSVTDGARELLKRHGHEFVALTPTPDE